MRMPTMNPLTTILALAALLSCQTGWAPGQEKTGLKIGAKAPEFRLKDQAGKERSLNELLQQGNVALVFYRSASW